MDDLRGQVSAMLDEERSLLAVRRGQVARASHAALVGGLLLMLGAAVFVAFFLLRRLQKIVTRYQQALDEAMASEERERQARQTAEALANDIREQCATMEGVLIEERRARAEAEAKAARAAPSPS